MSQEDDSTIDVEIATKTLASGCLICGAGEGIRNYTVDVRDGTTHTVPLCRPHFNFIRRERTAGLGESLDAAETRKITARVPKPLLEDLDERASELEMPRSELIRRCLRDGLVATETDADLEDFLVAAVESQRQVRQLRRRRQVGGERAEGTTTDGTDAGDDDRTADDETAGADVEFLKERVVRLESLLELALESD